MTQTVDHPTTTTTDAVNIRQLSAREMFGVWAAATAPMAIGSWAVAPRIADSLGELGLLKGLILTLGAGLIWQFILVLGLVGFEQKTLKWATLKEALWLRAPVSPKSGRRGGRLWLLLLPFTVLFALGEFIPALPHSDDRDFGMILESDAGEAFFSGNWGWFAVLFVMFLFNTVLGEELLFRGYLLPRMEKVFKDRAWLANGAMFGFYHLHVPWVIPSVLLVDTFALSYTSQRYRSAWIGIVVHSAQTLVLTGAVFALVLK